MSFLYTQEFIQSGFTYKAYRQGLNDLLDSTPLDDTGRKMQHYIAKNVALMNKYDGTYKVATRLEAAVREAPAVAWLVITEGWCGDAAFNIPMMAAVEKLFPEKVDLRLFLRDTNLDLMDANLTDGGRSIPKLIILNDSLQPVGSWGPRPAALQTLMKAWKAEGLELKQLLPLVHNWYDNDGTITLQDELTAMVKSYS